MYVSAQTHTLPVREIFQKLALIPGNVRTYPKVCVRKHLEYRKKLLKFAKKTASSDTGLPRTSIGKVRVWAPTCISVQKTDDGQRVKLILVVLGNPAGSLQVNPGWAG
jgi:hypothetical protein